MLYRVTPMGQITWNADFSLRDYEMFREHNVDLDRLDWKPVEEDHEFASVVEVALRHGMKTPTGIAVPAHHVTTLRRPATLRELFAETEQLEQHPDILRTETFMQQQMPGYKEWSDSVSAGVRSAAEESIRNAETEAEAELKTPVNNELLDWWKQLGGMAN